ncbi:MAG: hypothetical protein ACKVP3_02160 [Hyphomicrobiaceae bacterium]
MDMELNSPAHWRKRAEETRRLANNLSDPAAKQTVMEISESYEQLARMAETRALVNPTR